MTREPTAHSAAQQAPAHGSQASPALAANPEDPSRLPPSTPLNLHESVRDYWLNRVRQHTQDYYAGVPISKFPEDLRTYEHLLWSAEANVVIEIGAQHGGSAMWFRDRLATMARYGRVSNPLVVSIDLDTSSARANAERSGPIGTEGIHFVDSDVRDPNCVDIVRELLPAEHRCMVVEDGAHTYGTTMSALTGFAEFVPRNGFLVVEDGCVDVEAMRLPEWPRGVLPAIDDWLAGGAGSAFTVRRDLQLYGISCHPGGFLERVRA